MKRIINFEIEEDIINQVKDIAQEEGRNLSAQLRYIIMQFLKGKSNGKN